MFKFKNIILGFFLALWAAPVMAQSGSYTVNSFDGNYLYYNQNTGTEQRTFINASPVPFLGVPTGSCNLPPASPTSSLQSQQLAINVSNGNLYDCLNGTWNIVTGGGGGGSAFPVTVSGAVNSGGIPCFTSTTNEASSATLAAGDFILAGGAGACVSASFSVVPVANGGTATGSTLTGIVRGGNPFTASELSGDATTSGSNAVTVVKINGTAFAGTSTHLVAFGAANIPVDSGIVDTAAGLLAACTGCAPIASPSFTGTVTLPTTNVPTGVTLTIQSGGTLTCAGGSTCPSGGPGTGTQFDVSYWATTTTLGSAGGANAALNGVPQFVVETPSGSALTAPTAMLAGVPVNNNSETTCATQTLNILDRATAIFCSGTTTSTFNFPVHSTSGFGANFPALIVNNNSGLMTLTPTTDTIDNGTLFPKAVDFIYNNASGNWQTAQLFQASAFPSCSTSNNFLQYTLATGIFSCNAATGTGTLGGTVTVGFIPVGVTNTSTLTASLCDQGVTTSNVLTCSDTSGMILSGATATLTVGSSTIECAPGTGSGYCGAEGTIPTGTNPEGIYNNSTNHCPDAVFTESGTDEGCVVAVAGAQTLSGAKTFSGGIINTTTPIRDETRFVLVSNMTTVATAGVNIGSTGASNVTFSWPVTAANWYDLQCKLPVTFATTATIKFQLVSISGSVTVSNVNADTMGNTGAAGVFQDLATVAGTTLATSVTPITGAPGASEQINYSAQFLTSHAGNIGLEFIANGTNNVTMLLGGECGITQIN